MEKSLYFLCVVALALIFITEPLYAQETWVAFVPARGKKCTHYEGPPYHSVCPSVYAIAWGAKSKDEALLAAIKECETGRHPGYACGKWAGTEAWPTNCISVAKETHTYTYGGWGPYTQTNYFASGANKKLEAERRSLADCRSFGGKNCRIDQTQCTK